MERQIGTLKEKFDFLNDDMTQKTSKVIGDVQVLKEGLNLQQSTCKNQYKTMKESMNFKLDNLEQYVTECKENHKQKTNRLNELENEIKDLIDNFKITPEARNSVDEEELRELRAKLRKEFDAKLVRQISIFRKNQPNRFLKDFMK